MLTFQLSPKIKTKRKNIDTFLHVVELTFEHSIGCQIEIKFCKSNEIIS